MQLVIDESQDGSDFNQTVGELSLTEDNGGRIYIEYSFEGITTIIGFNLADLLNFIRLSMVEPE